MKKMLISVLKSREVRVAIVNSNGAQQAPILHDLHIEKFANRSTQGNIYKAKVVSINDQLQAAFVDFGDLKHGLLTLDKIHYKYGRRGSTDESDQTHKIADVLNVNDDVLVQVERDARVDKGAALTGQIQLHGQHVVLNTNRPITRISRQINREQRADIEAMMPKLKVPEDCGLVIRTSARGRSQKELQTDVRECTDLLKLIQQAYNESQAPRLLYEANNLVNSVLRDNLHNNIEQVIVDDKNIFEDVVSFVKSYMADFSGEIQYYGDEVPLYTKYRIEPQVSKVFDRTIELPSGGQIVLDPTEALLTIDVNSAQFRFNDNFRDMVLNTNLEAADEIFNQLRLRDIGGLIVVDFIDLYEVQDIRNLEDRVSKLCDLDRGRTKWEPISSFGLMELQRRRPRSSIYDTDFQRCDGCGGHGYRQTVDSVGHRIFREIEARSHSKRIARIRARVTPAVAQYLTNDLRPHLSMVEMRSSAKLEIVPDQDGEDASFVVESFSTTHSKTPVRTKNFEHGIPENSKSKKGKVNREAQAESIKTAAVKRPEIKRPTPKKTKTKPTKDKSGMSNVFDGATKFLRFVPTVPTYLYERLFLVENQTATNRSRQQNKNTTRSRKARHNDGRSAGSATKNQRVKQKITRHSPNKSSPRSSESKRFEERSSAPTLPTTKKRAKAQDRDKDGSDRDDSKRVSQPKTKSGEAKKKRTKKADDIQVSQSTSASNENTNTTNVAKTKTKSKRKNKTSGPDITQAMDYTENEVPASEISSPHSFAETTNFDESLESNTLIEEAIQKAEKPNHLNESDEQSVVSTDKNTSKALNEEGPPLPTSSNDDRSPEAEKKLIKDEILLTVKDESDSSEDDGDSNTSSVNAVEEPERELPSTTETVTSDRASNDPRIRPKENPEPPVIIQ